MTYRSRYVVDTRKKEDGWYLIFGLDNPFPKSEEVIKLKKFCDKFNGEFLAGDLL